MAVIYPDATDPDPDLLPDPERDPDLEPVAPYDPPEPLPHLAPE